jgi:hypothetical protein
MFYAMDRLTQRVSCERNMCFNMSGENAYLAQNEPLLTLQVLNCRKYSFQKLSQLWQRNHVVAAALSNIDGFLGKDACVFNSAEKTYFEQTDPIAPLKL